MGDIIVGSCVGYNAHEKTEFFIFVEVRKMVSRIATLDFQRADFILFRDLVDRVHLESKRQGSPGKLDFLHKLNHKGIGSGSPNVPKVEPVGERVSLAEQRASSGTQEEKEFMNSGRRGKQHTRNIELLPICAERKLEVLKPIWNSIW